MCVYMWVGVGGSGYGRVGAGVEGLYGGVRVEGKWGVWSKGVGVSSVGYGVCGVGLGGCCGGVWRGGDVVWRVWRCGEMGFCGGGYEGGGMYRVWECL